MGGESYEGRVFGRFRVLARVGAGGMGEVYLARDEHLRRDVAIKFLQAGRGRDRSLMRREAHALSRLNHPNIATVHDLLHEDDLDFVVMEFIEGQSLDQRLEAGAMDPETALGIARQIAAGLREAHEHGIVHRDLKPGNIMITGRGQVKLVDFGLAILHARTVEAVTVTDAGDLDRVPGGAPSDAGRVTGTLPYMAPEQIAGREIDARSDIWAFGAVLYQMVTGVRPFDGANSLMMAEGILNRTPQAPRALAPDVPPWLEEVILCALQKAPELRFQSVTDVERALEQGAKTGETPVSTASIPVTAASAASAASAAGSPQSTASPPPPPSHHRWRLAAAAGAVALLTIVGYVAWRGLGRPAAPPPTRLSVLVGDNLNRTGDATFDEVVTELLSTSLEQSRFLSLFPRPRASFVLQLMHRAPDTPIDQAAGLEICQREGLSALLTSSVTKLGQDYVLLLTLQDPSGRMLSTAREQFAAVSDLPTRIDAAVRAIRSDIGESAASIRTTSTPLAEVTSSSLEAVRFFTQGRTKLLAGDPKAAIVMFEKAVELDPKFAMAIEGIGVAYTGMQDYATAEKYIGRAAELVDSVPEAERHKILGDYGMLRRNYDEACSHLDVLTQLRPLDPSSFIAHSLCESYRFDNAAAMRDAQRAIDMQPTFRSRLNLARFQFLAGDATKALAGADVLRREVPAALHGHYVAAQSQLALGRLDEARRSYQTMIALGGAAAAEGHIGLGDLDLATGRLADAKKEFELGYQAASRVGNSLSAAHAATALAETAASTAVPNSAPEPDLEAQLARLEDSDSPVIQYLHARALARAGRPDDAARAVKLAAGAPPADQALAAMVRAEIALARGDAAAAIKDADAAWGFEPSVVARETQARAYAAAGQRRAAVGFYDEVLARATQRIDSYDAPGFHRVIEAEYRLGCLLDDLGERARARPHLERVAATLAGPGEQTSTYLDVRRRLATGAGIPTPTR